jgi:hypothetical protein
MVFFVAATEGNGKGKSCMQEGNSQIKLGLGTRTVKWHIKHEIATQKRVYKKPRRQTRPTRHPNAELNSTTATSS